MKALWKFMDHLDRFGNSVIVLIEKMDVYLKSVWTLVLSNHCNVSKSNDSAIVARRMVGSDEEAIELSSDVRER